MMSYPTRSVHRSENDDVIEWVRVSHPLIDRNFISFKNLQILRENFEQREVDFWRMSKKVSQEQLRKLMGSKLKKKPTKEMFI